MTSAARFRETVAARFPTTCCTASRMRLPACAVLAVTEIKVGFRRRSFLLSAAEDQYVQQPIALTFSMAATRYCSCSVCSQRTRSVMILLCISRARLSNAPCSPGSNCSAAETTNARASRATRCDASARNSSFAGVRSLRSCRADA